MTTVPPGQKQVLQIRKYSNRRFYDTTHSRHLTLEAIRDLVKEGHEIRVTDNGNGTDITAKILAQIILDLDGPKIELFPAALLAEIIRVNDLVLKGFYEKFFRQAHRVFLDYQKLMESHLKHGGGLPSMFPLSAWNPVGADPISADKPSAEGRMSPPENLSATLADLQRQVASLQAQLPKSQKPVASPARTKGRK